MAIRGSEPITNNNESTWCYTLDYNLGLLYTNMCQEIIEVSNLMDLYSHTFHTFSNEL